MRTESAPDDFILRVPLVGETDSVQTPNVNGPKFRYAGSPSVERPGEPLSQCLHSPVSS